MKFATARLSAERLTADHLPEVQRMHRDASVMAHLGGVRDDAQTATYLARNLKHWDDYGFGFGYAFYPPFWGRGLATEVASACLELGRRTLGLSTIVAVTSPDNLASQHVLEKVGLVYERDFMHEGARSSLFRTR